MWPPNQSLPNTLWSPGTAVVTSCTLHTGGMQLCPTGKGVPEKRGFKAQSSLSVSRYGFDEVDRTTGDTDGKEFSLWFLLLRSPARHFSLGNSMATVRTLIRHNKLI